MTFDPSTVAGDYGLRRYTYTTNSASDIFAGQNSRRVFLAVFSYTVTDCYIGPGAGIQYGQGYELGVNTFVREFKFTDLGPIVGGEWTVADSMPGGDLFIIEIEVLPKEKKTSKGKGK